MFDDNQIISVKWSSNNKKHYISKGYHYTYIGDEFFVPAKDMPLRSRMNVICICDYCGRQYQTRYANYNIGKDRSYIYYELNFFATLIITITYYHRTFVSAIFSFYILEHSPFDSYFYSLTNMK